MKTRLLSLAIVLVGLFVAGHFYAKPVLAQVRAALVQNVDEPGRNPYQESIFSYGSSAYCGTGSQFCNFSFSVVPAGKRLVVTHISGYVDVTNGTLPNGYLASSQFGSQNATLFFTGVREGGGASTRVVFNQEILAYFGPGDSPHGFAGLVSTTDTFAGEGNLMISGYYINL